ncbi:uncharacterized protein LOC121413071 [Lytechinus variegatus]|uniref:uncharacterized protein LOC121413071 n=1 Tax=Lytechinus variegatus TaxID=7654 RepID=UPI001BB11E52|nr:uncharacterized protein LOC121413071 [Lytechinus variegatus]
MSQEDAAAKSTADSESILGAVALKLPPFWRNDPEVWFAQAEAQFATRNIVVESTKYSYVIATLPPEVAQDIRDVLINPPVSEPYTTLKKKIIARTTESEQRRVQMLLTEEELGDRKPSQLLRRMEQLVGDQKLESGILRQLFLQRLPHNVRLILASTSESLAIADLAALADRILEAHVPVVNTVAPVTDAGSHAITVKPAQSGDTQGANSNLVRQIADLTKLVRELATTVGQLKHDRSRSRNRSKSKTRDKRDSTPVSESPEDRGYCWYHSQYAENAHRCKAPCNWNSQGNA